ncbi:alpha/beta fold hydrolase [Altererythrobacter salegens]|uniref:Alpha/beta fold hydrolase n=1 Tax=Croceibacterium salegens TaxID=1737568 RepID=A0A6I4SUZ3_9SPHN|nr:alpha/beta fold hydrolase [Croceibacterium salegens]
MRQIDGRWKAYFGGVQRKKGAREYYLGNTGVSLYEIDVATGKSQQIAASGSMGEGTGRLLGPDGQLAATVAIDIRTGFWTIKAPGSIDLASGIAEKGEIGIVGLGRDGDTLIYSTKPHGEDARIWYEVPLDGHAAATEYINADEIESTYFDRNTGKLIGLLREDGHDHPAFFDAAKQKAVDEIYKAFPRLRINLADWSPDFSHVLVRTSGPSDSGTWYLVDIVHMSAHAIGYEREAIGPEYVGPISIYHYKAQDGLDLDGVLTLPPGLEAKNLPLVMLPHGGPHAHDTDVFDWWAQAFASRGYAVFQPNFRGSTNRDLAFMEAGFGQWGKAMQTDVSDAIGALAEKGIVDPKRACIVGASYGGYAALAGVTLQHGVYRCAVAVAGVADVGMLFNSERYDNGRTGLLRRSLEEEFGPRSDFDAISPRKHAKDADAPILLIHGKDDTVVPFEQTTAMVNALKDAGKPYELVVLDGEDHWLSRAATRLQMLEAAVAFVERNNPAD